MPNPIPGNPNLSFRGIAIAVGCLFLCVKSNAQGLVFSFNGSPITSILSAQNLPIGTSLHSGFDLPLGKTVYSGTIPGSYFGAQPPTITSPLIFSNSNASTTLAISSNGNIYSQNAPPYKESPVKHSTPGTDALIEVNSPISTRKTLSFMDGLNSIQLGLFYSRGYVVIQGGANNYDDAWKGSWITGG